MSDQDFDDLVKKTYKKPYCFQQQDDCKDRQTVYLNVPAIPEDYKNDTVPEKVNHPEMGVSFDAWLKRSPNTNLDYSLCKYEWEKSKTEDMKKHDRILWWERNFYPHVSMVVNDLHAKGLLPAGELGIKIDW